MVGRTVELVDRLIDGLAGWKMHSQQIIIAGPGKMKEEQALIRQNLTIIHFTVLFLQTCYLEIN